MKKKKGKEREVGVVREELVVARCGEERVVGNEEDREIEMAREEKVVAR